jgi:hypothetical protein
MDAEYSNEFHRKFDEDDVNQCREKNLENINRHFYKKNPELLDATHLTVSKSSRSVLDLCRTQFTKMVNGKQQFWFVCLLGKCYQEGTAIKIQKHSTCNGTSHLLAKHAIQSSKTTAHKRNAATLCKHIEGADDIFPGQPC